MRTFILFQGSDDSADVNAFDDIKSLVKVMFSPYLIIYVSGKLYKANKVHPVDFA